ncbi:hypothetical protein PUN28_000419 [Cardiocondyla obscurior]|uniref:Uncharacterized protein n=1 Tax=Cardiocondyla obscurior TaxID=286306 RepID=A0AAW2GZF0_9HYME
MYIYTFRSKFYFVILIKYFPRLYFSYILNFQNYFSPAISFCCNSSIKTFGKTFRYSPNGHVEDVTADGTRHGHVAVSLSRNDDACDKVRYAGASCEERQAHHFRRYGHCVAGDIRPPDHQVRVRRDPEDRADERYREELFS